MYSEAVYFIHEGSMTEWNGKTKRFPAHSWAVLIQFGTRIRKQTIPDLFICAGHNTSVVLTLLMSFFQSTLKFLFAHLLSSLVLTLLFLHQPALLHTPASPFSSCTHLPQPHPPWRSPDWMCLALTTAGQLLSVSRELWNWLLCLLFHHPDAEGGRQVSQTSTRACTQARSMR